MNNSARLLASLLVLAGAPAQATELTCTYVLAENKTDTPVTRVFTDITRPNGRAGLFECMYPMGGPQGCSGRAYELVQNNTAGIVAVAFPDDPARGAPPGSGVKVITFAWDRSTGNMQLAMNDAVRLDGQWARGRCRETKP